MHDFVILSGALFTLAENLAIIYYMIYIPYWLTKQGLKFVIYAALLMFAFQILMHTFE